MADDKDGDRWTVRGVDAAARRRANECAGLRDQTLGAWLGGAIHEVADKQADDAIIPPGGHGGPSGRRPARQAEPSAGLPVLADVTAFVQAAAALAGSGFTLAGGSAREVNAALRAGGRLARGLPLLAPRQPSRQTRIEGPVIEAE